MPTITIQLDDLTDAYTWFGELTHRLGSDYVDLDATTNGDISLDDPKLAAWFDGEPTEQWRKDLDAEADPTPPHGTPRPSLKGVDLWKARPLIRDAVDCPHPGCPGRIGVWCGNPRTGRTYGDRQMHNARSNAWKAQG